VCFNKGFTLLHYRGNFAINIGAPKQQDAELLYNRGKMMLITTGSHVEHDVEISDYFIQNGL
jgi:hypothetical protein